MTDPLEPPAWRQIPVDVQDRIMQSTLDEPAPRRRSVLAPFVASLAALAVGAVFTIQATGGGAGPPSDANPGLDRCAAAARDSEHLADRSEWEQVFESPFLDFKVIAARAAGKPVFCELTPTTVTVSTAEPLYVRGTGAGLVMTTPLGTIAGVADPSWHQVWIRTGESVRPASMVDGMFIGGFLQKGDTVEVASTERPAQWVTLPFVEERLITVVDARQGPIPDRSAGRGRVLDDCVKAAEKFRGVIDQDSWEPGAMVQEGTSTLVVTRNAYGYSTCLYSTDTTYGTFGSFIGRGYYQADKAANQGPVPRTFPLAYDQKSGRTYFAGVVSQDTRRVQVACDDVTVEADVANSTFAALLPNDCPKRTLRLHDSTGKLTYEGR